MLPKRSYRREKKTKKNGIFEIQFGFSDRSNLKISTYHQYFGAAVKKWLSVARNKILHRIERSVEREKLELNYNIKFTPSSLDLSNCFSQISQFWRRLGRFTTNNDFISTKTFDCV